MDDDIKQLEAELKQLQPIAPSGALRNRIEAELKTNPVQQMPGKVVWMWVFAALPAAAAAALAVILFARQGKSSAVIYSGPTAAVESAARSEEAPLKPVAAEKLLVSADDEGLVTLD